jgi:phosphoserine phosphatase RsbU/P
MRHARDPLLRLAAFAFAAASILYGAAWMYHARQEPVAFLGVSLDRSLPGRLTTVAEGSPAEKAGLHAGDRIVAVNGRRLVDATPFYEVIRWGKPGDVVTLEEDPSGAGPPVVLSAALAGRAAGNRPTFARRIASQLTSSYPMLFLIVGLVVLWQRHDSRDTWLLALMFAGFVASAPTFQDRAHRLLRPFVMTYAIAFGALCPALFYYFFATFPASSPVDRRLPWLKWLGVVVGGAVIMPWLLYLAFVRHLEISPLIEGSLEHPALRMHARYSGVLLVLGLVSLIWSTVRAPSAEARRKTRVMVWGTIVGCTPAFVLQAVSVATRRPFNSFPFPIWASAVLLLWLLPLSFAYAVVRHRVLEVPVLLKRSARYLLVQRGFLILLLAASVAATAVLAAAFRRFLSAQSDMAMAVGAGFGLLLAWAGAQSRRRVTHRIDRAFFRSAYDARQILEHLAERTRVSTNRQDLASLLEKSLDQALHPTFLIIYLDDGTGMLERVASSQPIAPERISGRDEWLEPLAADGRPAIVLPPPHRAPIGALDVIHPECLVPVRGRTKRMLGLLVLGARKSEEPYSREDLRLLMSVAIQAGVAVENIALAEAMAERLQAERSAIRELEIAKEVQQKLFPQQIPSLSTLDYVGACLQAREVGGDYYDFLDLGASRVGLVLADVSGKGIAAALLMANLQASIRSQIAIALEDPVRLLESVNRRFYESTPNNRFATMFFGTYADSSRELTYATCGHNPPLVVRHDGSVERLAVTAPILGCFDPWQCRVERVTLERDDLIVIFSDGVTEAWSDAGEEFGDDRVIDAVRANRHLPARLVMAALIAEVQRFNGREQEDDITVIVGRGR